MRHTLTALAQRRRLRLLLSGALVTTLFLVAPAAVTGGPRAAADQPVSNAFALGGGLGGSVDPRTGGFSVSVPLVAVASEGTSEVSSSLNYDQSRAGAGIDRFGFGDGWSLGTTFIDPTDAGTVYPASGGAYTIDDSPDNYSHLLGYPLKDMRLELPTDQPAAKRKLAARRGAAGDIDYSWALHYDDGRVDYYDANGNLIVRMDRFGHRTDLTYTQLSPTQWQPATIVDDHGLTTTFTYSQDTGNLTVSAPARSDGVVASTVVAFSNDTINTVTDPLGTISTFYYGTVAGSNDDTSYLTTVTAPSGASSIVTYQVVDPGTALDIIAVQSLQVVDVNGNQLTPTRTMDLDPLGTGHNYTGYPDYEQNGSDGLFQSGDPNWTYTTKLSNGLADTVSTYDSAHRLATREIDATDAPGQSTIMVQTQQLVYPPIEVPTNLPGNYFQPTSTSVTFGAQSGPDGISASPTKQRTTTTGTQYDDHGRVVSKTDAAGTTTKTTYDNTAGHFGLVTSSVATGEDGTVRTITNTLSADGSVIKSTTRSESTGTAKPTPRTVTSYDYDNGLLTKRTVSFAAGQEPPGGGGGPASSVTSYVTTIDAGAATKTITATVAEGTTAAQTTTTVVDLVTGLPVAVTDPVGRVTTKAYDAGGRITTVTPPTGLATSTSYVAATPTSPASQTVTEADGHQTRTTFDALSRAVLVTDNVAKRAFVSDAGARTLSTSTYSADDDAVPTVATTDQLGRTSTVTYDPLGRAVRRVGVTGVTQDATFDDAANTTTTELIADNASSPYQITQSKSDALNREVYSRSTYPTPSPAGGRTRFLVDPPKQATFDDIGRPTAVTAANLTTVPSYDPASGLLTSATVTPTPTNPAPSAPITSTTTNMLTSQVTARSLQQAGSDARPSPRAVYDAAGNVTSLTDPNGKTTTYTYAADGQLLTRTTPDKTVTVNTYDPVSGQLTSASVTPAGGATATTTYAYVPKGKLGAGKLASVTDATGTISYGYDTDGNRTSVSYPDKTTASQVYSDNGQLLSSTDVTGAVTTYGYTTAGLLHTALQARAGATLASVTYAYDGLARIASATRGNKLVTRYRYTADNQLAGDLTTAPAGPSGVLRQVESHSYTYDRNHNLVSRTDQTADPRTCTVVCVPAPNTYGTWTTTYSYDALQRLTGSAVYAGAEAVGTPRTTVGYTLDLAGNVVTTTRVSRTTGTRPTTTTSVTVDGYDAANQLTSRQVGSAAPVSQVFDAEGRVTTSVTGTTFAYRPDGLTESSTTKAGAVTTYAYWPDGSRRQATTVDPRSGTTSVVLHYGPDGAFLNDTTTQSGTGNDGTATASYLVTAGREARTLQPGSGTGTAAAPVTTGAGVGYLLRDRHTSVTALVDSTGTVTNTYAYGDYGTQTLLDGRPGRIVGAVAGVQPGRANPLTYDGAATRALYTMAADQTMITTNRVYDPAQGRFLSRDPANVLNRYVAFGTNPVMKVDPTGLSPIVDTITDIAFCIAFAIGIVATGGAAAAAGGAIIAGIEAGTEIAAAAVQTAVWQAAATAVQVIGITAQSGRLADDITNLSSGKRLFSDDTRQDLSNIATAAGSLAGAAGLAASAGSVAEDAAETLVSTEEVKPGTETPGASAETVPEAVDLTSTVERPPSPPTTSDSTGLEESGLLDANTGERATPLRRTFATRIRPSDVDEPLELSEPSLDGLDLGAIERTRIRARGLDPSDDSNWNLLEAGENAVSSPPSVSLNPSTDPLVTSPANGVNAAVTVTRASQPGSGPLLLAGDAAGQIGSANQVGGQSLNAIDQVFMANPLIEE